MASSPVTFGHEEIHENQIGDGSRVLDLAASNPCRRFQRCSLNFRECEYMFVNDFSFRVNDDENQNLLG